MSSFERTVQLTVLAGGRNPLWTEQTSGGDGSGDPNFTGAPDTVGRGVDLADALLSDVVVQLREDVARRTARIFELNHVGGETYTVSIGGHAVAYVSGALDDWDDVVNGLVAALPGVPDANGLVTFTATDDDDDGVMDTLLISGRAEAQYSIGLATTGLATMRAECDPNTCNVRIYRTPLGSRSSPVTLAPSAWALAPQYTVIGVSYRGWTPENGKFNANGLSRGYVEISSVASPGDAAGGNNIQVYLSTPSITGHIARTGLRVFWGPCITEE